jgi:hypothetical protein
MSSNSEFDAQARRGQGAQKSVVLPEFLREEEAAHLIVHIYHRADARRRHGRRMRPAPASVEPRAWCGVAGRGVVKSPSPVLSRPLAFAVIRKSQFCQRIQRQAPLSVEARELLGKDVAARLAVEESLSISRLSASRF